MKMMKACVVHEPGNIVYEDVPMPELGPEEALIKIEYTGVCGSDAHIYAGRFDNEFPIIPGHEYVGKLVDVRSNLKTNANIGDTVVGQIYYSCNNCELCNSGRDNICFDLKVMGVHVPGSFAEYCKVPAKKVMKVSDHVDTKMAVLAEPLAVGVHSVNTGEVGVGDKVFIIGGGVIGICIAVAAKLAGASNVILSEVNKKRIEFARMLGFTVIDAGEEDVLERVMALSNQKGADVVFEVTGTKSAYELMTYAVKRSGIIVQVGISPNMVPIRVRAFSLGEIQVRGVRIHNQKNFETAVKIIESGIAEDMLSKFVTHEFVFSNIKEAMNFQESNQEHFKIILKP
ncbi:alcohol dehydrogenase catalytic domain-containing protein [Petroclostridium sp. X23]|uniref:zinc-dependent alcohol dehydrogenase n=1 Tax=Petroclostridium sp. X23 TaxID=3045146 RepID=UPI0024AD90D5|nr:alcohol dehydrogenase catalytic domain-containing protein [Petroclostridium sp. X23]WHH60828.1 alcohol dehydrogenase catalytic domain-containing protein [Petroclostridium sp. X23]